MIGLLSGKISGEEYLEAMSQILAPIRNIIANTAYIFSSDQTSDQEVYQYGKDAGTVFTDIGLTVAGGTGLAKVTSKLSKAARATKGIQRTRKTVKYGPMNRGPLADEIANTFRSGTYTKITIQEEITLYRVYGGKAGELGSYWTRTKPQGPLQLVIDSALVL